MTEPVKIGDRLSVAYHRAGVRLTIQTAAPAHPFRAWVILDFAQVVELESRLLDWLLHPAETASRPQ